MSTPLVALNVTVEVTEARLEPVDPELPEDDPPHPLSEHSITAAYATSQRPHFSLLQPNGIQPKHSARAVEMGNNLMGQVLFVEAAPTETINVVAPLPPAMLTGEKLQLAPAGSPEQENETICVKTTGRRNRNAGCSGSSATGDQSDGDGGHREVRLR